MHDSLLTEDQRMIRDSARAFAQERLAPTAGERDRGKEFPRDEMAALGALGFLGMLVPETLPRWRRWKGCRRPGWPITWRGWVKG